MRGRPHVMDDVVVVVMMVGVVAVTVGIALRAAM